MSLGVYRYRFKGLGSNKCVSQLVRRNADLEGTMASDYENRVSFASILPRKIIEGNESTQLSKHEAYWKSGRI